MHLNPIDPHFYLAPNFLHNFVATVHYFAIATPPRIWNEAPSRTAHRGQQRIAAGAHARAKHNAGFDGVAQVHPGVVQAVGVEKAGDPGRQ